MDLDSELTTHESLVDREIIVQGLLSRQVALVEANLFDSPAIRLFFANHWRTLSAMAKAPGEYETPLLASASRAGRDVYAGLDQLLARGDPPRPAWLSSLSAEQNQALRADLGPLKDANQRRARFVEIVGGDIGTYLRHLNEYVGRSEAPTVVDSANKQVPSLYDRVSSSAQTVLGEMTSPKYAAYRAR